MSLASRLGRLARSHLLAALSGVPAEAYVAIGRELADMRQAYLGRGVVIDAIKAAHEMTWAEKERAESERDRARGLLAEARVMVAEQERRAVAAEVRLAALGEGAEA